VEIFFEIIVISSLEAVESETACLARKKTLLSQFKGPMGLSEAFLEDQE
jgi:hypothetical protein